MIPYLFKELITIRLLIKRILIHLLDYSKLSSVLLTKELPDVTSHAITTSIQVNNSNLQYSDTEEAQIDIKLILAMYIT